MTNEELLQDLKQFISATVSQQTAGLATKDDIVRLEVRIDKTDAKLDEVKERLEGVAGMVEDMHKKVNEHDLRIERLEHKFA